MTGIISPSTLNLFSGKAFVLFKRDTLDANFVHLGKLTDISYDPKVEVARYYDQSQGIAILIDAFTQQVGGEGTIVLNEATAYNWGLAILGNPQYRTPINAAGAISTGTDVITMPNVSGYTWVLPGMNVYDQTAGVQIGTVQTWVGTTLTLTAVAANAGSGTNDTLIFGGTGPGDAPTAIVPFYGFQSPLTGALQVIGTSGKGPRPIWNITRALITPKGPYKAVDKEYGTLTINFEHLADDNQSFGYEGMLPDVNTIKPTNWTAPFITSPIAGGGVGAGNTPAYANHTLATLLTCATGQWTAGVQGVSYAFQWYNNVSNANTGGTAIAGAVFQKYTPVVGDATDYLYCVVTATNSIGSTSVASGTTQAVV